MNIWKVPRVQRTLSNHEVRQMTVFILEILHQVPIILD